MMYGTVGSPHLTQRKNVILTDPTSSFVNILLSHTPGDLTMQKDAEMAKPDQQTENRFLAGPARRHSFKHERNGYRLVLRGLNEAGIKAKIDSLPPKAAQRYLEDQESYVAWHTRHMVEDLKQRKTPKLLAKHAQEVWLCEPEHALTAAQIAGTALADKSAEVSSERIPTLTDLSLTNITDRSVSAVKADDILKSNFAGDPKLNALQQRLRELGFKRHREAGRRGLEHSR